LRYFLEDTIGSLAEPATFDFAEPMTTFVVVALCFIVGLEELINQLGVVLCGK
jgi:hypothetical protein